MSFIQALAAAWTPNSNAIGKLTHFGTHHMRTKLNIWSGKAWVRPRTHHQILSFAGHKANATHVWNSSDATSAPNLFISHAPILACALTEKKWLPATSHQLARPGQWKCFWPMAQRTVLHCFVMTKKPRSHPRHLHTEQYTSISSHK
jgi:hypothetical protein